MDNTILESRQLDAVFDNILLQRISLSQFTSSSNFPSHSYGDDALDSEGKRNDELDRDYPIDECKNHSNSLSDSQWKGIVYYNYYMIIHYLQIFISMK